MTDISKYDPISGVRIARNVDQWMNTVIIDKGNKDGVKSNMVSNDNEGLVGRVTKVNQFSTSRLIIY